MNNNDRINLIKRIGEIEGLTDKERSALLGLLRESKSYGLVWEDKPEAVEERLRDELPVLTEVKEKAIINAPDAPNHILIEGDNLEALTTLAYTHEGKIDMIYIDPPYNTGNKDFVYNDSYVDKEDSYRHSKWLSFMSRRLKIAKRLLSDRGVIFISIDDNEQAQLKLLCDEIFGAENEISVLPTIMNLKGNQDEFGFAGCHEYTIVFSKQKVDCKIGQLNITEEDLDTWEQDDSGYYKKGATLKRTGADAPREKRPYCYFPILVAKNNNSVKSIELEEYKRIYDSADKKFDDDYVDYLKSKYNEIGYYAILPIVNDVKASWRWGFDTVKNNKDEIIVIKDSNSVSLYKKQRPEFGSMPTKKPKSILYKPEYSSGNGTAQLKAIGLERQFSNPKPIDLIVDLCQLGSTKGSTILDFFAGSGTTLHATMQLNAEDGGHRQCILVTNKENGICENVTYVRNKRVIEGYTTPKGEDIEGLHNNNLRYYKTDFVSRERSAKNMRKLVALSTDMLCIKENLYTEQLTFGNLKTHNGIFRYFDDGRKKMLVIYREEAIDELVNAIDNMAVSDKIIVYVFSPSEDPWEDSFAEVSDRVELCALPQAIYNTYQRILPKRKDALVVPEADALTDKVENPTNGMLNFTEEEEK